MTLQEKSDIKLEKVPQPKDNFSVRDSLLTELFKTNTHIRTFRNLMLSLTLFLFFNTFLEDSFQNGQTQWGLNLIQYSFGKLHITALSWICFIIVTFLCYLIFTNWAVIRIKLFSKCIIVKVLDIVCLMLHLGYYMFTFYVPVYITRHYKLPPASAAIVLMEQVRLAMKVHAFVRTNAPKVLKYKPQDEPLKLPTFGHFLYFLFAPTLIYHDEYPRTETIRWKYAAARVLELAGTILLLSILFDRYLLPPFRKFGSRKFTWLGIFIAISKNSAPSLVIASLGFYIILHITQNFFAEILRFGDRTFYQDWWTSTQFSEYYRNWNMVVHKWLHVYIYKEIVKLNKLFALTTVFVVSAVVHEWIFCNAVAVFFPAVTLQYLGTGVLLYFVKMPKNNISNIIFLCQFSLGVSILLNLYILEYYARLNSPISTSDMWETLLPRWLTCDCIETISG